MGYIALSLDFEICIKALDFAIEYYLAIQNPKNIEKYRIKINIIEYQNNKNIFLKYLQLPMIAH